MSDSEGPNNPGTMADDATVGTIAWANPDNAKTSNNNYATAFLFPTNHSHYLKATNFGFAISGGATIDGIIVEIERFGNGTDIFDEVVSLVVGGAVGGDNKKNAVAWAAADPDTYVSYGANNDVWSCALTPTNVNAADFGMVLQVENKHPFSSFTASVDHIRITVYYTTAGGILDCTSKIW